ncbi:E3 ubiquitin-protein ligase Mdm2-like isoform X2 [Mizuhopecten yessoensis]|uniref:E3 ubiquitin-protein ligase Mdm2-like isoform X2 n=1 Tax=Mizuhopecten yessoensis TaxID=6573 RepID=UPI000B45A530|nr:E3 ubiquitin-protein ligase Mdm2-like isoform X2 [Mizuhopecten yessoensis]
MGGKPRTRMRFCRKLHSDVTWKPKDSDMVESTTTTTSATGSGQSPTGTTTTTSTATSQYVVAEEYTVGVPLFRPKQELLTFLRSVGATGDIFTRKEICQFLKQYIGSHSLYDPHDPRLVYCQGTVLGQVFGVDKFTISDVLDLIGKNCYQVPDTCIKRKCHYVTRPLNGSHGNPTGPHQPAVPHPIFPSHQVAHSSGSGSLTIEVCRASPIVTSSTGPHTTAKGRKSPKGVGVVDGATSHSQDASAAVAGKLPSKTSTKRKRKDTGGSSGSSETKRRPASVSITYNDPDTEGSRYPWYFQVKMETTDEESEVLSIQGQETTRVQDSTDDMWFVEDEDESVTVNSLAVDVDSDTFSVEYELDSDIPGDSDSSDISSPFSEADVLVVCNDSDVQFWADHSSGPETDTELSDEDKWSCQECKTKNSPTQRYCSRCWKLRPDWLPDRDSETRQSKYSKRRVKAVHGEVSSSDGEMLDSGIYTSCNSAMPTCSQTTIIKIDDLEDSKPDKQDTTSCPEKEISLKDSPEAKFIGMRRTFLNYRSLSNSSKEKDEVLNEKLVEDKIVPQNIESQVTEKLSTKETLVCGTQEKLPQYSGGARSSVIQQPLPSDMCMTCLCRPKTASIIHGSTGHQVCCFKCARRLKRQRKPCPVCRRPIQKVIKNFIL